MNKYRLDLDFGREATEHFHAADDAAAIAHAERYLPIFDARPLRAKGFTTVNVLVTRIAQDEESEEVIHDRLTPIPEPVGVLEAIQSETRAAKARTGDQTLGTTVKQGKLKIVRVVVTGRKAKEEVLSEPLPYHLALRFLWQLGAA